MTKNIFGIMAAVGAVVLLSGTMAKAEEWHRRPPVSRSPEPLTLVGIGAGVTALLVARRFTKK